MSRRPRRPTFFPYTTLFRSIDSLFQTKVGDNLGRIVSVLRLALERSDAVIVCGGLGPTQDDITREAIAEVMGVELERDPEVVRSEEHTSELQSHVNLVCRLL